MKWPCRKDEVANGDGKGNANEWSIGYNYCLEECKAAYEKESKIHSCKCRNNEDGAMTAKKLDDGLFECPRCGGIIIFKKESKLVPLDEKELANWVCTSDWSEITSTEIAKQLCARFGCPDIPTVEEIKTIMDKVDHTPVPIDKVNSWTMEHTKYMYAKTIHALLVKRR